MSKRSETMQKKLFFQHVVLHTAPECTAKIVRRWLENRGVSTLYIKPGSPWENGYNESFNGKLRDELLNGEIFYTLQEAQVLIARWRREYNTIRPHSSLGYRSPAPEKRKPPPFVGFAPSLGSVLLRGEYSRPLNKKMVQKMGASQLVLQNYGKAEKYSKRACF